MNLELLQVYAFDKKCRLGSKHDGGYVIAELEGGYDCYISAGISWEESFSRDFVAKYEISNNYGFDGTIEKYPSRYTDRVCFIKKNINTFNDDYNTDLSDLIDTHTNIFLKMDIEGCEYPWILHMNEAQLSKCKQIVIEFHEIMDGDDDKIRCLEKLSKTHYIVHAHGNKYGKVINGIPDVIELTYVNKKYFTSVPELNTQSLPSELDSPNYGSIDIDLNFYPFKMNLG